MSEKHRLFIHYDAKTDYLEVSSHKGVTSQPNDSTLIPAYDSTWVILLSCHGLFPAVNSFGIDTSLQSVAVA
jgi:hypothetical protein